MSSHQKVKFLIRTAQLYIRFECHRVISLKQGIEKFADRNGGFAFETFFKIVTLQHSGDIECRCQLYNSLRTEFVEPLRVENHFGLFGIEDFENLCFIRFCIFKYGFSVERFSGNVFARRITDHSGKISDQKLYDTAEFLKERQFLDQYGMSEVQIGCGRVEARFDIVVFAGFQVVFQ